MNEDELMTTGYGEDDDSFLPSGYAEGDDFFADPSTWSGASEQTDESVETQSEEESTETSTETEEAPTTGEAEEDDGRSAEEETAESESGQTTEPVKTPRILKLKVNHNSSEVDINSMTDEELVERLQKAAAFDAMKDDQMKTKYRQVYADQLFAGMTEAAAKMIAAHECGGKDYPLEDPAGQPEVVAPAATPASSAPTTERDFESEVRQIRALFPDFKEMPDEVALAAANGSNLLTAYVAYRNKQTSKAAASLKKENEVLKQNAASAAKAPVKGVTGGGSTNTKPKNDLLAGFDSDDW